jgi:nucleotide-binding universal stress UspA family protein
MKALLAIDGSQESAMAIETAASLTWPPDSRLEIISVAPTEVEVYGGAFAVGASVPTPEVREQLVDDCRRRVDAAAERLRRPGLAVAERVIEGRAASVILEEAERTSAELIIVGARQHGTIERVLLGSVSAEVVDHAHCPVLVARKPTAWRVLIATDGSSDAALGAGFVAASGLFDAAGARVVNVVDVPAAWWLGFTPSDGTLATDAYATVVTDATGHARSVAAAAVRRLRAEGMEAQSVLREGPAPAEIIAEAESWDADLVVVGTRGHGLLKRLLLGSTARTVLHHAPMSVLIVRPSPTSPGGERSSAEPMEALTPA